MLADAVENERDETHRAVAECSNRSTELLSQGIKVG